VELEEMVGLRADETRVLSLDCRHKPSISELSPAVGGAVLGFSRIPLTSGRRLLDVYRYI
jgi:hypothetical protein